MKPQLQTKAHLCLLRNESHISFMLACVLSATRPKPLPHALGVFSHSTSSHSCIRAAFRPNLPVHSPRQSDTVLTDLRDSARAGDFRGITPFFWFFLLSEMKMVQEKYMSYGNFPRWGDRLGDLAQGLVLYCKNKKIEIDETNVCEAREREREGEWEKKSVGGVQGLDQSHSNQIGSIWKVCVIS